MKIDENIYAFILSNLESRRFFILVVELYKSLFPHSNINKLVASTVKCHTIQLQCRAQELGESRGGRPGLPSLISLMVSVDIKYHDRRTAVLSANPPGCCTLTEDFSNGWCVILQVLTY